MAQLLAEDGPRKLTPEEAVLCQRVLERQQAEEATWGRQRWDAQYDHIYEHEGFDAIFRARIELARLPMPIGAADDQLHDPLRALKTFTAPSPAELEEDVADDFLPPEPTLVEWLAYLLELGTGDHATAISARRAGIIREAMDAIDQEQQQEHLVADQKAGEVDHDPATATPAATTHFPTDIERLDALLEEAKKTGKAAGIYAAKKLLALVPDGEFNDFVSRAKRAEKESRGKLRIDVSMLKGTRSKERAKMQAYATAIITDGALATHQLASLITKDAQFAVDAGRRLYVYVNGVYVPSGEAYIKRRAKAITTASEKPDQWTKRMVEEVVEFITVDAHELWERPPLDRVNVLNGLLDVNARKLAPHSPEFRSPVQLPVAFDPTARCPRWDGFVGSTFPADTAPIAWEILAWLMTPDVSIQKAILLTGDGANGKSTFVAAVLSFIGRRNASAVSLHKLEGDKFAVSRLVGKLVNACPDLPSNDLVSTSVFKAVTGGDAMTAERKFEQSFDFVPYARLLFSANHPPKSEDASPAFFRRWIVVPFENVFVEGDPGTVPRAELDAALADPKELSGVLNNALDALPHLRRHGFSESDSTSRALLEFRQTTDPLSAWLDNHTTVRGDVFIPADQLFGVYCVACMAKGKPTPTKTAFGRAISHLRPTVQKLQRKVNGELRWCYVGIGLRTAE